MISQVAEKQLEKLDRTVQKKILEYIVKNLKNTANPRRIGKPLRGKYNGLWRYKTGKYRIICNIKDDILEILIIKIGHRSDIYKN